MSDPELASRMAYGQRFAKKPSIYLLVSLLLKHRNFMNNKITFSALTLALVFTLPAVGLADNGDTQGEHGQVQQHRAKKLSVTLPLVKGWFDGKPVLYLTTDVSDPNAAKDMGVNYVPRLTNAISSNPSAVDDIYAVTNFAQGNVIPSAPIPTGPDNQNADYSPLWQVSTVTWKDPQHAHTLKSEKDVLDAKDTGMVDIAQTNIVVNCPVIYSPEGGLLPNARITK
jgi:hypothetical protein